MLDGVVLDGVVLDGVVLDGVVLDGVVLDGVVLDGVVLEATVPGLVAVVAGAASGSALPSQPATATRAISATDAHRHRLLAGLDPPDLKAASRSIMVMCTLRLISFAWSPRASDVARHGSSLFGG